MHCILKRFLKVGNLGKLYLDRGAGVLFAKLFDELAEGFPKNKINRLQDLINS